jgi:hypothetical protein
MLMTKGENDSIIPITMAYVVTPSPAKKRYAFILIPELMNVCLYGKSVTLCIAKDPEMRRSSWLIHASL